MSDLGEQVRGRHRPHSNLLTYYGLESMMLGPFFLLVLLPRYLRYRTLRYRFDDEGVTMSWGALFHRQVSLTYGRIQDIHLTSNLVQRWLGLARVQVQTAAGAAAAEMTIEGLRNYDDVRDFLYSRMRAARGIVDPGEQPVGAESPDPLVAALRETTAELRGLREQLAHMAEEQRK